MYQRILVSIDGSPTSDRGLDEAAKLATVCGSTLRLIHIVDPIPFTVGYEALGRNTGRDIESIEKAAQEMLDAGKARALAAGAKNVETVLVERTTARISERIVEQAKTWNAELIVIGTHGRRGVGRMLLGSDAEQTVRISPVPVLLVRAPEEAAAE
ncbi:MAG: universal stress protein [Burkholderiales bacterium]